MDRFKSKQIAAGAMDGVRDVPGRFELKVKQRRESPLYIRLADCRDDLEQSFRLLQSRYRESGLTHVSRQPMRILSCHLWDSTQVFVAEQDGRIVGTVTLVMDGHRGLPIADLYPREIAELRRTSVGIGEITSLAVRSSESSHRGAVFAELTRLLTFFARGEGLDALVAVVHPRHGKFYQRAMGFRVQGQVKGCQIVGGRPGIAVMGSIVDPSGYRPRWRRHYFDGSFGADLLRHRPISPLDRHYFQQVATSQETPASSRAA